MTDAETPSLAAVRRLCAHWHEMTRADYAECLAPESVYFNVPKPEARRIGPDAAFDALERWRGKCRIDMEVLNILGDGSLVFCERLERFENLADGRVIDLYVTGVFETDGEKILVWRDYYDAGQAPSVLFD